MLREEHRHPPFCHQVLHCYDVRSEEEKLPLMYRLYKQGIDWEIYMLTQKKELFFSLAMMDNCGECCVVG